MADRFASRRYSLKNKLGDRMIKQLLNSVIAKYRDLPVSRTSIICLSLWLRQITDLLATDKSRYFAQPRSIIVTCFFTTAKCMSSRTSLEQQGQQNQNRVCPTNLTIYNASPRQGKNDQINGLTEKGNTRISTI